MTYWYCTFIGRRNGATGSACHNFEHIEAKDKKAARGKLYDTYEHISELKIVKSWVDKDKDNEHCTQKDN